MKQVVFASRHPAIRVVFSSDKLAAGYEPLAVVPSKTRVRNSLTAQYGSDRLVCQALVSPSQMLLHGDESVSNMSSDEVTKILGEIATDQVRGKELNRGITNAGCNQFRTME